MADKKDGKKRQLETCKKVLRYIKRYKWILVLSLFLALITVACTLYIPVLTGNAIDLILEPGKVAYDGIFKILTKIVIAMGIAALTQWIMNVCNNQMTYRVVRDIRNDAFERIEKLPFQYLDAHQSGEIVSRVIADADQFADGLLMGFTQLFTGLITIFGTIGFMISIHFGIAMVVVCMTPLSLFVANFIAKKTFSMFKRQSETRGEQTALIDEMLAGTALVE